MQVEVSKHTEGLKDKMIRPNGLPESLIRYDGMLNHIQIRPTLLSWLVCFNSSIREGNYSDMDV